jgi:hypothetical protein
MEAVGEDLGGEGIGGLDEEDPTAAIESDRGVDS